MGLYQKQGLPQLATTLKQLKEKIREDCGPIQLDTLQKLLTYCQENGNQFECLL
jgi:hypothetical protein